MNEILGQMGEKRRYRLDSHRTVIVAIRIITGNGNTAAGEDQDIRRDGRPVDRRRKGKVDDGSGVYVIRKAIAIKIPVNVRF